MQEHDIMNLGFTHVASIGAVHVLPFKYNYNEWVGLKINFTVYLKWIQYSSTKDWGSN